MSDSRVSDDARSKVNEGLAADGSSSIVMFEAAKSCQTRREEAKKLKEEEDKKKREVEAKAEKAKTSKPTL